jgi:hypothetical protein
MTEDDTSDGFPLPDEVDYSGTAPAYVQPVRPTRSDFYAWHHPRKQYVREKQWTNAVNGVMRGRDAADRIKYVGLPGIDLLDVRQLLRTVCEPTGRRLQYVGFDIAAGSESPAATELNISESELRARTLVHKPSEVRPDDIRYVGRKNTSAWRAVKNLGHVDVVNLDLTTTVFDASSTEPDSYMCLVKEILALQAGNPHPWVMFLTTKVDETMKAAAIDPLLEKLKASLEACAELVEAIEQARIEVPAQLDVETCPDDARRVLALTGGMQWMHELVQSGQLAAKMKVLSCFYYTSFAKGGNIDMASLVIRFDPVATELEDRVYSPPVTSPEPETADRLCAQYVRQFERISNGADIGALIQDDLSLRAEMVELSASLLEEARYSREEYAAWTEAEAS